jgi:hypothetical protein
MRFTILARDELLTRDRNGVGLFRTNRGTPFAGRRREKSFVPARIGQAAMVLASVLGFGSDLIGLVNA